MTDHQEAKRVAYARDAKAYATLERLERENPTRPRHYLSFAWYAAAVVGLPVAIAWTLYAAFGG